MLPQILLHFIIFDFVPSDPVLFFSFMFVILKFVVVVFRVAGDFELRLEFG